MYGLKPQRSVFLTLCGPEFGQGSAGLCSNGPLPRSCSAADGTGPKAQGFPHTWCVVVSGLSTQRLASGRAETEAPRTRKAWAWRCRNITSTVPRWWHLVTCPAQVQSGRKKDFTSWEEWQRIGGHLYRISVTFLTFSFSLLSFCDMFQSIRFFYLDPQKDIHPTL